MNDNTVELGYNVVKGTDGCGASVASAAVPFSKRKKFLFSKLQGGP
jgi:hypothetical protein